MISLLAQMDKGIFNNNRVTPHGLRVYVAFLAYLDATGLKGKVTLGKVAEFASIPLSSFQKHFRNIRDTGFIKVDTSYPKEPKYTIKLAKGLEYEINS